MIIESSSRFDLSTSHGPSRADEAERPGPLCLSNTGDIWVLLQKTKYETFLLFLFPGIYIISHLHLLILEPNVFRAQHNAGIGLSLPQLLEGTGVCGCDCFCQLTLVCEILYIF